MRTPTEYEIDRLLHYSLGYDPVAAKKYYEEHKHLIGRKPGVAQPTSSDRVASLDPRSGFTQPQIHLQAKARQRGQLIEIIGRLEKKLKAIEALIKTKEHEEKSKNHKSAAKQERAAKEKDKPKTAAEKAQAARDSAKYQDKHKQEIKTKSKSEAKKSGGDSGSKQTKTTGKSATSSELRSLATKMRGQIAVAKQKLIAL